MGTHAELCSALHLIGTKGRPDGLTLNYAMCSLYWHTEVPEWIPFNPLVKRQTDGMVILGTPPGCNDFIQQHASNKVETLFTLLRKVTELDDLQVELLLLRSCVGFLRIIHLLRTCSPLINAAEVDKFDREVDRSIGYMTVSWTEEGYSGHYPISRAGILLSRSMNNSSLWMLAIPSEWNGQRIDSTNFKSALKFNTAHHFLHVPVHCRHCKNTVTHLDAYGDHAVSCPSTGERIMKHNAITKILSRSMTQARITHSLEVRVDRTVMGDIVPDSWINDSPLYIDVSVANPVGATDNHVLVDFFGLCDAFGFLALDRTTRIIKKC